MTYCIVRFRFTGMVLTPNWAKAHAPYAIADLPTLASLTDADSSEPKLGQ